MWEAMVADMRATNTERDNRRHFVEPKKSILDSREFLADLMSPGIAIDTEAVAARTAANFTQAAQDDIFEVG